MSANTTIAAAVSPLRGRTWLITGATGFIGGHLCERLLRRGDQIVALTRNTAKARMCLSANVRLVTSLNDLTDETVIDGIVNLAGAQILGVPWTAARRRILYASRIETTHAVVGLCARLRHKPTVLVSGSAIGYYGVHNDELLDESAPPQPIFQSQLCSAWETAANAAAASGVRVVCLRTGIVMGADGGALPKLALPLKLFGGAIIGTGRQWLSWIHIDDMVQLILFVLDHEQCKGAFNATSPQPLTYGEFDLLLARLLHRPLWLRIPGPLVRLALGEMAQLLVDGQRVVPQRAQQHGFAFQYPTALEALRAIYCRPT